MPWGFGAACVCFVCACVCSRSIGMASPNRVIVTGGASANPAVISVLANVFGVPVFRSETVQSAALGA